MSEETRPKENKIVDKNQRLSTEQQTKRSVKITSETLRSSKKDLKLSAKSQIKKSEPQFREYNESASKGNPNLQQVSHNFKPSNFDNQFKSEVEAMIPFTETDDHNFNAPL